jgi:hypothetical protein
MILAAVLAFAVLVAPRDEVRHVVVDYSALLTDGDALPSEPLLRRVLEHDGWLAGRRHTAVRLAAGEGYLVPSGDHGVELIARLPEGTDLAGRIFAPHESGFRLAECAFRAPDAVQRPADAEMFDQAKSRQAARVAAAGVVGGAWFRHVAGRREAGRIGNEAPPEWQVESDLERTFDLFSGAQALAENLRLGERLPVSIDSQATIDVTGMKGITVRQFDFGPLLPPGGVPDDALDALAAYVPADQHAVFFPSLAALAALVDESLELAGPLARLLDESAVDRFTSSRLEKQLCLPLSDLARRFGDLAIAEVAMTGSDPFLRTGADVGILLLGKPGGADAIEAAWKTYALAQDDLIEERRGDLTILHVTTADRAVHAFLVRRGDVVLISNSRIQVAAFAQVLDGGRKTLRDEAEYRYFRTRYEKGGDETALVVIPDAAIRNWCSPRSRIAASRRARAMADLLERRCVAIDDLAAGRAQTLAVPVDEIYGTLSHPTPLAEIPITRVSTAEYNAYSRFRDSYERGFVDFFDPIAARLRVTASEVEIDLTIIPLILDTELREIRDVVGDEKLASGAGRPHDEAVAQLVVAIDPKAAPLRDAAEFLSVLDERRTDALGWVGRWLTIYFDADPFLDEMAQAEVPEDLALDDYMRLPLAVELAVADPLRAGIFLTSLRLFGEQTVPGLFRFETREHLGKGYVRVTVDPSGYADLPIVRNPELFYAIDPGRLILALNESMVQRALAPTSEVAVAAQAPWLGESAALRIDERAITLLSALLGDGYFDAMRGRAFRALPILEEWRRLFPDRDPVAFHEEAFHERLLTEDAGYRFDAARDTMTTDRFGDPAAPKASDPRERRVGVLAGWKRLDLGLGFEHGGARARLKLVR